MIKPVSKSTAPFRWEDIEIRPYKERGTFFKAISRQTLVKDLPGFSGEVRYFELEPGGYSTLERHKHAHAVLVVRGRGAVLIGDTVYEIAPLDVIRIPPMTWHQFRAPTDEYLGFICLVDNQRDRPQRPTEEDLKALRKNPTVASFIRI